MEWYSYVALLFAAVFFANALPHLVNGASGDPFPTPFSKPGGRGLSSPQLNVIWAMVNILIGYVLFRVSHADCNNPYALIVIFIGITAKSIGSAINFQKKEKE